MKTIKKQSKAAAWQGVGELLTNACDVAIQHGKNQPEIEAAKEFKGAVAERLEAELQWDRLQKAVVYDTRRGTEAIGFLKGKLVYAVDGNSKPVSLAEAVRLWARMESQWTDGGDGGSWDEAARVKFLRLVAARLDGKGGAR